MRRNFLLKTGLKPAILFFALSGFIFQSCLKEEETDFEKQVSRDNELIQNYISQTNNAAIKADTGYYAGNYYTVQTSNDDGQRINPKDIVAAYYSISLIDGTVIENYTPADGPPLKFEHLDNAMVPFGLDFGTSLMQEGETYTFILPSNLAFQNFAAGSMPANAVLLATLDIVDVLTPAEQKAAEADTLDAYLAENGITGVQKLPNGLVFQSIVEGTGNAPSTGQLVSVAYTGRFLDGTEFDKSPENDPFEFQLGQGSVIPGWDEGIRLMKPGGKAKLYIPSHLAYGETVQVFPRTFVEPLVNQELISPLAQSMPPYSILVFDVELK